MLTKRYHHRVTENGVHLPYDSRLRPGAHPTVSCSRGNHANCHGKGAPKHGLRTPCSCQCHKVGTSQWSPRSVR